jgi:hypothetical protein
MYSYPPYSHRSKTENYVGIHWQIIRNRVWMSKWINLLHLPLIVSWTQTQKGKMISFTATAIEYQASRRLKISPVKCLSFYKGHAGNEQNINFEQAKVFQIFCFRQLVNTGSRMHAIRSVYRRYLPQFKTIHKSAIFLGPIEICKMSTA